MGDLNVILKMQFSILLYWLVSSNLLMIMFSDECHRTLLIMSTLLCQATSHYLNQCWPRSPTPYDFTRPQWVENPQKMDVMLILNLMTLNLFDRFFGALSLASRDSSPISADSSRYLTVLSMSALLYAVSPALLRKHIFKKHFRFLFNVSLFYFVVHIKYIVRIFINIIELSKTIPWKRIYTNLTTRYNVTGCLLKFITSAIAYTMIQMSLKWHLNKICCTNSRTEYIMKCFHQTNPRINIHVNWNSRTESASRHWPPGNSLSIWNLICEELIPVCN